MKLMPLCNIKWCFKHPIYAFRWYILAGGQIAKWAEL